MIYYIYDTVCSKKELWAGYSFMQCYDVRMMLYPVSYILYSGTVKNSAEIVLFLFFWKTRWEVKPLRWYHTRYDSTTGLRPVLKDRLISICWLNHDILGYDGSGTLYSTVCSTTRVGPGIGTNSLLLRLLFVLVRVRLCRSSSPPTRPPPHTRCPLQVSPVQSLNGRVLGQAYPGVVNWNSLFTAVPLGKNTSM